MQVGSFGAKKVPIFEKSDVTKPYVHVPNVGYIDLEESGGTASNTLVAHLNGVPYKANKQVNAEVDYFETGDTSRWDYTGDPGRWRWSSAISVSGNSLELQKGSGWNHWSDENDSGHPNYPIAGKEHQFWFKIDADAADDWKFYIEWAGDGLNDHAYESNIYHTGFQFEVQDPKYDDGTREPNRWSFADEQSITWNRDQWYRMHHRWVDNGDGTDTIEMNLYTNDNTHVAQHGPGEVPNQKRGDWLQINWGPGCHVYFDQWSRTK